MAKNALPIDIIITRNGSPVKVVSGSFSRLGKKWSVTVAEPMPDLSYTDLWSMSRRVAGRTQTLIENATPLDISGTDGESTPRTIFGTFDSDILYLHEYCVPKTTCFCSPSWVMKDLPGARLKDGILKYPRATVDGYLAAEERRVFHPRLPGKEYAETDYQCVFASTHRDIARWLGQQIGYKIESNTPDLTLIDTLTILSGTTWKAAIESIFAIWQANFKVVESEKIIYIMDIVKTPGGSPRAVRSIFIDNPAIVQSSFKKTRGQENKEIDHLIVIGRKTSATELELDPPISGGQEEGQKVLGDFELVSNLDLSRMQLQGQDITFGDPENPLVPKHVQDGVTRSHYKIVQDKGGIQYYPTSQVTEFFGADGVVGKTEVYYTYSESWKLIHTVEDEHLICKWPREDNEQLRKLRTKVTYQNPQAKGIDTTSTSETITEAVLFTWNKSSNGEWYRNLSGPLADLLRQNTNVDLIDTRSTSMQDVEFITTHYKGTYIGRETPEVLVKRDFDVAAIPGAARMNSQILENPQQEEIQNLKNVRKDNQFRREYFRTGTGKLIGNVTCYHPPITITHDDITTDTQAEMIRDRVWAKAKNLGVDAVEVTVETPVPLIVEDVTTAIKLPPFKVYVNGVLTTIPGGSYYLKDDQWQFSVDGQGNQVDLKSSQRLTVRNPY